MFFSCTSTRPTICFIVTSVVDLELAELIQSNVLNFGDKINKIELPHGTMDKDLYPSNSNTEVTLIYLDTK